MADLHLSVDRAAGGIAGQITRELREAVRQGRLAAGVRLPASRELARDLGLSRGVVVEAYEQLVAEGFLVAKVGAGTRVAPAASRAPGSGPGPVTGPGPVIGPRSDSGSGPAPGSSLGPGPGPGSGSGLGPGSGLGSGPGPGPGPGPGSGLGLGLGPGSAPVPGADGVLRRGSPGAGAERPVPADAGTPVHECDYGRRPTSPDLRTFPRERWLAATRRVLASLPAGALDYGDPGGVRELREELAAYLRRVRGADATADELVIVGGVAQGLSLTVQVLAGRFPEPGEHPGRDLGWFTGRAAHPADRERGLRLAVEDPTGLRQLPLLRAAGADLVAVPADEEGIDVAALAAAEVRAVLLTPAHHYPTGVVLSPRRRAELTEWAAATGAVVLEDDYDAEFRFDRDPVGCLQGLAPGRVVLAGSVSKSLAPGLRLGWVVAPPHIAGAVRRARAEQDMGSPVLEQHVLADLLRTGAYDRHLRRMRREYRARRDALVRALAEHLPEVAVWGVSAGLHLFAELPGGWDERAVAAAARARGLAVEPVAPMRHRPGPPALVMGFARLPAQRAGEIVAAVAGDLAR
ncbi:gntR family transcriptional regulator [Planomonospora sphaerica]|uniref:GntR family transcriptional regulator n=1 Tax=Planomonospora sphaerica TaxID=161355 RepID=A0A161LP27_9ACTN|nr:PLP-dependent aminotransferase family protein [Planomonospora sphaerica]GAT69645.1 gntR family transcriptional regulator [Planomonospora sphaerica]